MIQKSVGIYRLLDFHRFPGLRTALTLWNNKQCRSPRPICDMPYRTIMTAIWSTYKCVAFSLPLSSSVILQRCEVWKTGKTNVSNAFRYLRGTSSDIPVSNAKLHIFAEKTKRPLPSGNGRLCNICDILRADYSALPALPSTASILCL